MTTTLPILVSVPHAGLQVPDEVAPLCRLTPREIAEDGDEHAAEIYDVATAVARYVTTDVARAIVDLNRSEDDRRQDGVVKTHTCFNVRIYERSLSAGEIDTLLSKYYRPYHARLRELVGRDVVLGLDCHTMLAVGPPIGPGAGEERPHVCLSNGDGTCPPAWMAQLLGCFEREFGPHVSVNDPFRGGFIARSHARDMPWVQLELSRAPFANNRAKREAILSALRRFVAWFDDGADPMSRPPGNTP